MMNYLCDVCKYSTNRKFNLDKHILTKKHHRNMDSKNGCSYCFASFSSIRARNYHQKNSCKLNNSYENRSLQIITQNNIQNNQNIQNTTNNVVIIVAGEEIQGIRLADMIKHPASIGVNKRMLEIINASTWDFMDIQHSFDNAVLQKSNEKLQEHETYCLDDLSMCYHGRNGVDIHQLDKREVDNIIKDELMKTTDKFYLSHVPQLGLQNVDMRVIHAENERAMFPLKVLNKLCKHSSVQHLLGFDVNEYVPGIIESEYLRYHKECYQRVLLHITQDNNASKGLAVSRRSTLPP